MVLVVVGVSGCCLGFVGFTGQMLQLLIDGSIVAGDVDKGLAFDSSKRVN